MSEIEIAIILVIAGAILLIGLVVKFLGSIIRILLSAAGIIFLALLLIGIILYSDARTIAQSLEEGSYNLVYTKDGETVYAITEDLKLANASEMEGLSIIVSHQWLWKNSSVFSYQGQEFTQEKFTSMTQGSDEEKILALSAAFGQKVKDVKAQDFLNDVINKEIDLDPQPISTRILQSIPLQKIKGLRD